MQVELDEMNKLRSMLISTASAISIDRIWWIGEEFEPPTDKMWLKSFRTNIHGGELVGKHASLRRFRNTFFYTLHVNIPKSFSENGIDVEQSALLVISKLKESFPSWAYLGPVAAVGYISNGLTTKESEFLEFSSESNELGSLFALGILRVTVQHIYYQS